MKAHQIKVVYPKCNKNLNELIIEFHKAMSNCENLKSIIDCYLDIKNH